MAVQFSTRTVPAPDNTAIGIDLGVGEYVMIPLALGAAGASYPLGWSELFVAVQTSLKGGPSTGNITQLSTEGIEMGFCQGTSYPPTHASFYGIGLKCVGNYTGVVGGGGLNIYFTKNPWNSFIRSGGTDTPHGNSSQMYTARDETANTYPGLNTFQIRHYNGTTFLMSSWPQYGVEAWIPRATRKMMHMSRHWSPRDHVNAYFNTELGIGFRAGNPSNAAVTVTAAALANLDTIWFRNFMTTGHTWRLFYPTAYRSHHETAGV